MSPYQSAFTVCKSKTTTIPRERTSGRGREQLAEASSPAGTATPSAQSLTTGNHC